MSKEQPMQFWIEMDERIAEAEKDMKLRVRPNYREALAKFLFRMGARVSRSKVSFEYRR